MNAPCQRKQSHSPNKAQKQGEDCIRSMLLDHVWTRRAITNRINFVCRRRVPGW